MNNKWLVFGEGFFYIFALTRVSSVEVETKAMRLPFALGQQDKLGTKMACVCPSQKADIYGILSTLGHTGQRIL